MTDKLSRTPDCVDDEVVTFFWMNRIEVDGIFSSSSDPETDMRRLVTQPMFELKEDTDPTPQMRWDPDYEVDEKMWLEQGRIVTKY